MKSSGVPRTGIRIGVGIQTISILAVFVLVNYLSFQYFARRDYSRSQKFALAEQTKRVLRELKKPVEITVIASPTFVSPVSQIFGDVRSLLAELQFSGRERIRVDYVDPTRDLSRMRELQERHHFATADNLLILTYDGRTRLVSMADMADFDFRPVAQGDPPRLLAFRGEQALTGAMIALLRPEDQTVYFLTGHGEPDITSGSPISVLVDYLLKQNVKIASLSLAATDAIPSDAAAVVVVAPRFDLEEREAVILRAWWAKRGRLLVLLDPDAETPRLHSVLGDAGVRPRKDRVLRTIQLAFATGILRDVTGVVLPTSQMTQRLAGATILFPGATQSLALDEEFANREKIQLRKLVEPAEEFWGETDFAPNNPAGVRYDDGRDNGQPLTIAASADRGGIEDDRVEVQTSRLIVVGSAQFVFDSEIKPSGLDFVLGSVNALLDRTKVAGLAPKNVAHFALNLTDRQLGMIALFTMIVIPGLAALSGVIAWWRRRS
ncbi:MAG: Gldg family protein [Terrimicrobiaceae bacterium]